MQCKGQVFLFSASFPGCHWLSAQDANPGQGPTVCRPGPCLPLQALLAAAPLLLLYLEEAACLHVLFA